MKDKFIKIFKEEIRREGADTLLRWIESTDFFEAPASTRFHSSRSGGLVEHSINVYERLHTQILFGIEHPQYGRQGMDFEHESIAICGLLHDICKANFYKVEMRNRKNEAGQWEQYPFYVVDDQLPYGHGEKSVYIVSGFMKLTREEAFAIRWHMGSFDESVKGGSYSMGAAWEKFPLAVMLHIADLQATYLDEADANGKEKQKADNA